MAEYAVYPDCTGYIMNLGSGLFQNIVVVDGGNEIRSLGILFPRLNPRGIDSNYTASSDCTGETAGLSHFVLVGDGSEAFLIRTIGGWVVTGFPKRQ